ncbi:hypothetical protein VPH35_041035 [Triticum aestivum]
MMGCTYYYHAPHWSIYHLNEILAPLHSTFSAHTQNLSIYVGQIVFYSPYSYRRLTRTAGHTQPPANPHSTARAHTHTPPPPALTPENGRKMALTAIPNELLADNFLRLPTLEDLIRASTASSPTAPSSSASFPQAPPSAPPQLRRLQRLPPRRSASPSAPVASAADFDFEFLPAPSEHYFFSPRKKRDWSVRDVRDGRVLLDRPRHASGRLGSVFKEMVVCDPLHRQHLLLPPLPHDLAAWVVAALLVEGSCFGESFLAPFGGDEDADATEDASFRVIWMLLLETKPVGLVFSSGTGQWRAITSLTCSLPGFVLSTWMICFLWRHYAHGCFYWISGSTEKLLVLDIRRMEFSMADHPPCVRVLGDNVAIVEASQGVTVMLVPKPDTSRRIYTIWRNNGGSSTQWQMENETFSLDPGSLIIGAVGRHLLLYYGVISSAKAGCYTRDVNTLQLERVCASCPHQAEAYCNFAPSLLSSPTVSSVPCHADHRGVDDSMLAPEPQESDPGGVEGPTGQEPTDLAGGPPHKRRRRSVCSGSRTRGGGSRLDPWWMRAWGQMRGQIKVLSRTAVAKTLGGWGE